MASLKATTRQAIKIAPRKGAPIDVKAEHDLTEPDEAGHTRLDRAGRSGR